VTPHTDHFLGYKEYVTGRTYMAKMGDWRENKDIEIPLDGIGGVNVLVKADVHRSGRSLLSITLYDIHQRRLCIYTSILLTIA